MSSHDSKLNKPFAIRAQFPSDHIQAIGYGEVGPISLTFADDGSIKKAEAELVDAPYKRMLIDDPAILRIFGQRGEDIDMSVLHPTAKFRLDALDIKVDDDGDLDMASFDVGRLVDITNMPSYARFGWSLSTGTEEGAVHRRVRESLANRKGKNVKRGGLLTTNGVAKNIVVKDKIDANTSYVPTTVVPPDPPHVPTNFVTPNPPHVPAIAVTPAPPTPTTPSTTSSSASKRYPGRNQVIPGGHWGEKMKPVLAEIYEHLSKSEQETYNYYMTDGRKDAVKSEASKAAFYQELRAFVEQHDILELYNTFAGYQRKSGSNKLYRLPTFDD